MAGGTLFATSGSVADSSAPLWQLLEKLPPEEQERIAMEERKAQEKADREEKRAREEKLQQAEADMRAKAAAAAVAKEEVQHFLHPAMPLVAWKSNTVVW